MRRMIILVVAVTVVVVWLVAQYWNELPFKNVISSPTQVTDAAPTDDVAPTDDAALTDDGSEDEGEYRNQADRDLVAAVDKACSNQARSKECAAAKEMLANQLASDLLTVAGSLERQYRPKVRLAAELPYAEVRAAAAETLWALRPDEDDTETLRRLMNDPAPAVRHPALQAYIASTDAHQTIVDRVQPVGPSVQEDDLSLEPDPLPEEKDLGVPIYPALKFLYFASNPSVGRASFSTTDSVDQLLSFYSQRASGPAMTVGEFETAIGPALLPSQENAARITAEVQAQTADYQRWSLEIGQQLAAARDDAERQKLVGELETKGKEFEAKLTPLGEKLIAARADADIASVTGPYRRGDLFAEPRFLLLRPVSTREKLHYLVVFKDLALGGSGVEIHYPPPSE